MSKRISKSFALNANDLFAPWVPVTAQNDEAVAVVPSVFESVFQDETPMCRNNTHAGRRVNRPDDGTHWSAQ